MSIIITIIAGNTSEIGFYLSNFIGFQKATDFELIVFLFFFIRLIVKVNSRLYTFTTFNLLRIEYLYKIKPIFDVHKTFNAYILFLMSLCYFNFGITSHFQSEYNTIFRFCFEKKKKITRK